MKKSVCLVLIGIVAGSLLIGCGNKNQSSESQQSKTTFEDEADEKEPEKNVTDEKKDEIDYSEMFSYQINEDGKTINISAYKQKGENKEIEIPEKIDGYTVTGISYPNGQGTFFEDNKLEKVIISDSVIGIGDGCFMSCENLEEIVWGKDLKEIGEYTFANCKNLKELNIPEGVKKIKDSAIVGCEKLESVTLPSSLETIEDGNFMLCNPEIRVYVTGESVEKCIKNLYETQEDICGEYIVQ